MTKIEIISDVHTGFNRPRKAEEGWATDLRIKHRLSAEASLEEVESKATELLGNPLTTLDGAELVLGRRIDGSEKEIAEILSPFLNAEGKFGLLLMQKSIEEMRFQSTD